MANPVGCIISASLRKREDRLNLLILPFDGHFEKMLCSLGHSCYCLVEYSLYEPLLNVPNNYIIVDNKHPIPIHKEFDYVIINDRIKQYKQGKKLSEAYHIPLIIVDHINPKGVKRELLANIKETQKDILNVAVSELISESWNTNGFVIEYGLDEFEQFDKNGNALIIGKFVKQDYQNIIAILKDYKHIEVYGNNQGLSNPIEHEDKLKKLAESSVFINLSTYPQTPFVMLEAMANGCLIITNNYDGVKEVIQDGVNGVIAKNVIEFREYIDKALSDKSWVSKLGMRARETIKADFSLDRFKEDWEEAFNYFGDKKFIL